MLLASFPVETQVGERWDLGLTMMDIVDWTEGLSRNNHRHSSTVNEPCPSARPESAASRGLIAPGAGSQAACRVEPGPRLDVVSTHQEEDIAAMGVQSGCQ